MIQVLHDTAPVARKRHACDNCGRMIEPGETYHRQDNVGDDGRYTWKSCAHCDVLVDAIYRLDPYAGDYDYGLCLDEWLREYGEHYPEVTRLFRAKWREPDSLVLVPVAAAAVPEPTAAVPTKPSGGQK